MVKRRRRNQEPEIEAKVSLGTVANTDAAVHLFATMLRSVEMEEKGIAEEKDSADKRTEKDDAT
jgi:hypothetical protein